MPTAAANMANVLTPNAIATSFPRTGRASNHRLMSSPYGDGQTKQLGTQP
jgi:hypothetical protein